MRAALWALAALLFVGQAFALSCAGPPSELVASFNQGTLEEGFMVLPKGTGHECGTYPVIAGVDAKTKACYEQKGYHGVYVVRDRSFFRCLEDEDLDGVPEQFRPQVEQLSQSSDSQMVLSLREERASAAQRAYIREMFGAWAIPLIVIVLTVLAIALPLRHFSAGRVKAGVWSQLSLLVLLVLSYPMTIWSFWGSIWLFCGIALLLAFLAGAVYLIVHRFRNPSP